MKRTRTNGARAYVAELARHAYHAPGPDEARPAITGPDAATDILRPMLLDPERERFAALYMNTRNQMIAAELISIGSLNCSIVHPREVFRPAVHHGAAGLILAHNHPSGDPTPSEEDVAITRRLVEAGRMIGIEVLDHIILTERGAVSLKDRGVIR